jgi:hypothetical protein
MVAIIMTNSEISPKSPNQLVGNMGLFHVCYELSKRGWNCLPTSRNAKGIDLVIYSQDAKKMLTIQVKSLSHKNPVPFGKTQNLMAEFLIVCVLLESPVIYILKAKEAEEALHRGEKEGHISYWLQSYEDHKDSWNKIGTGFDLNNP